MSTPEDDDAPVSQTVRMTDTAGSDAPMPPLHGAENRDDLFRLLVENVRDYAIFMLDPGGHVASWNAGAQNIKGYNAEEILGRHVSVFYDADAVARRWPQYELEQARRTGRFEDEGWRVRKDGTRFWANVVISAVRDSRNRFRGFAKVTRDLTARREMDALRQSEARMNEFLAMLAHELRNPLSPIQNALDIGERQPNDLRATTWARQIIQRQTHLLTRLVDDLLDVSRITRDRITLKLEPVDIKEAVAEVVEGLRPMLQLRRHELDMAFPAAPLLVRADPARLAQVISNIVGNAAKYTPDGGRISIRASEVAEWVAISFTDNGIGISADLVPRVFDLFVQGERQLDRREGGLGVGLTLAKRLVELQGGTLSASSAGPGRGSEFTLGFPILTAERPPERRGEPRAAQPPPAATVQRVMVVDDNVDAAESLAALLEVLGHQVIVLHDGANAVGAVAKERPHVVLLDIGLPGLDGYEIARRLRRTPGVEDTRLIACTGYGREDDIRRINEAGFDQHLIKPVGATDLERVLGAEDGCSSPRFPVKPAEADGRQPELRARSPTGATGEWRR
jgi:PAS domain S-box-containing protein